jgi:hypothetical protein
MSVDRRYVAEQVELNTIGHARKLSRSNARFKSFCGLSAKCPEGFAPRDIRSSHI